MSETLRRVQTLVLADDFQVSDHGYEELAKDDILAEDAIADIARAVLVEDYPERGRILTLQHDINGSPIHVVWALPADERRPAVLVTAYRPDLDAWDENFRRRKDK